MEEEFIRNQERLKPQEEKIEVIYCIYLYMCKFFNPYAMHYSFTALLKECNFKVEM
jgi:hypothetical protein